MNEVTEWAEHAQQLPDAVVEKFAVNKISGYDFPELVQNDGIMLQEELDITRRGLQNRVLRSMRLLLLGVDEKPDPVQNATVTALSCSRIRIDWQANVQDKLTFPVHKYVVQRSTSKLLAFLHMSRASLKAAVSWQTICEGLDTTCEDWVPAGFTSSSAPLIEYRITAWNALRRSERVVLDLSSLSTPWDRKCPMMDNALHVLMIAYFEAYMLKDVLRTNISVPAIILTLVVLGLPLLLLIRNPPSFKLRLWMDKYRKRPSTSQTTNIPAHFLSSQSSQLRGDGSSARKSVDGFFMPHMSSESTGSNSSWLRSSSSCNSAAKEITPSPNPSVEPLSSSSQLPVLPTDISRQPLGASRSLGLHAPQSPTTASMPIPGHLLGSMGRAYSMNTIRDADMDGSTAAATNTTTTALSKGSNSAKSIRSKESGLRRRGVSRDSFDAMNSELENILHCDEIVPGHSRSSEKEPGDSNKDDKSNRCSVCGKAYRTLKWRWRKKHFCTSCGRLFCSLCGNLSHSDFLACKEGHSSCLCSTCKNKPTLAAAAREGSEGEYYTESMMSLGSILINERAVL